MEADLFEKPKTRALIVPRPYQNEATDTAFKLWGEGTLGVLIRLFTGGGKTLTACLAGDTWLRRGTNYRMMVVSYEVQLVGQFAEEIRDYLGISPGIEMAEQCAAPGDRIVVSCRPSLLVWKRPSDEQLTELADYDLTDLGACTEKLATKFLKHLRKGGDADAVREMIAQVNLAPEADGGSWSRLHKFDWRFNWLIVFDEAHRHGYHLPSVGPIVDWFDRNPDSRRVGLTATPKRGDGVSIGHKMFPGVAVDYPLYSRTKECAVKEGWAVPYVQRYIEVEGVDFRAIKRDSKGDFDGTAMQEALLGGEDQAQEEQLAKLVTPMLDMADGRRTLIFSPTVAMAKDVARFINARARAACECGLIRWHPKALIGDGAECDCGRFIDPAKVLTAGEQARSLDGTSPDDERNAVYRGHQSGEFQFLSVCGLCREGYNDPDIACVTIFRPVSEKASALAEQMKGRSCRVLRDLACRLHTFADAAERVAAIAASAKPNALIIDLVGITGLADCASTVEIYADGLPDEVKERAKEILAEEGQEEAVSVEEAIEQAEREAEETRERIKREREEAEEKAREEFERRSRADAQAKYTAHEVGYGSNLDPNSATEGQMKFIRFLGLQLHVNLEKKRAGRIIGQLKSGKTLGRIAYLNNFAPEDYEIALPSPAQMRYAHKVGVRTWGEMRPIDVSLLIDAKKDPRKCVESLTKWIGDSKDADELTFAGVLVRNVSRALPPEDFNRLVALGQKKRRTLSGTPEEPKAEGGDWTDELSLY